MKNLILIFILISIFSCQKKTEILVYKTTFSLEEKKVLEVVNSVINSAIYSTLITLDKNNQPRARVIESFLPESNYVVWMATNPKSRKVTQLKNNTTATMHYFDKNKLAYVSLMGNAYIVTDEVVKNEKWKDGWEKFYPNKNEDFLLIKFIPKSIELISISDGFTGDKTTWKPHQVVLFE